MEFSEASQHELLSWMYPKVSTYSTIYVLSSYLELLLFFLLHFFCILQSTMLFSTQNSSLSFSGIAATDVITWQLCVSNTFSFLVVVAASCFEAGCYYISLASQMLTVFSRLALKSQHLSCLSLLFIIPSFLVLWYLVSWFISCAWIKSSFIQLLCAKANKQKPNQNKWKYCVTLGLHTVAHVVLTFYLSPRWFF